MLPAEGTFDCPPPLNPTLLGSRIKAHLNSWARCVFLGAPSGRGAPRGQLGLSVFLTPSTPPPRAPGHGSQAREREGIGIGEVEAEHGSPDGGLDRVAELRLAFN